jgi:hypothetical protein
MLYSLVYGYQFHPKCCNLHSIIPQKTVIITSFKHISVRYLVICIEISSWKTYMKSKTHSWQTHYLTPVWYADNHVYFILYLMAIKHCNTFNKMLTWKCNRSSQVSSTVFYRVQTFRNKQLVLFFTLEKKFKFHFQRVHSMAQKHDPCYNVLNLYQCEQTFQKLQLSVLWCCVV